jgi:hypothetical protein
MGGSHIVDQMYASCGRRALLSTDPHNMFRVFRVLHKLAKMNFSRRPAEHVQGVQAFAQTFSQVKKVTHGKAFCTNQQR